MTNPEDSGVVRNLQSRPNHEGCSCRASPCRYTGDCHWVRVDIVAAVVNEISLDATSTQRPVRSALLVRDCLGVGMCMSDVGCVAVSCWCTTDRVDTRTCPSRRGGESGETAGLRPQCQSCVALRTHVQRLRFKETQGGRYVQVRRHVKGGGVVGAMTQSNRKSLGRRSKTEKSKRFHTGVEEGPPSEPRVLRR